MGGARLPFVVDTWRKRSSEGDGARPLHFLTHIHTDHTLGLDASWALPLYCSGVTRALLLEKFSLREELVVALEVGQAHVLWTHSGASLTVTVIDANHCPGAVMFLFEGSFGAALHTGDFRFSRRLHVEQCLPLSSLLARRRLDKLFLDNTYCTPFFEFPPTSVATAEAIALVDRLLAASALGPCPPPYIRLVVGLDSVGKEPLLVALALRFRIRVGLHRRRLRTVELSDIPGSHFRASLFSELNSTEEDGEERRHDASCTWIDGEDRCECVRKPGGDPQGGASAPSSAGVRLIVEAVDRRWIDAEKAADWNEQMPTFVLLPSVRSHLRHKPSNGYTFTVPYSEHSSYGELVEFVGWLRPREILPTVVQTYRSLKKHLLPCTPGTHLGDLASFRMSNPFTRNQGVCREPSPAKAEDRNHGFVPATIHEYQALYPWTVNVGLGNQIRPSLFRAATADENDLGEALNAMSSRPARALSSPLLCSSSAIMSDWSEAASPGPSGCRVNLEQASLSGLDSWLQRTKERIEHSSASERLGSTGSSTFPKVTLGMALPLPSDQEGIVARRASLGSLSKGQREIGSPRLRSKGGIRLPPALVKKFEDRKRALLSRVAVPLEGDSQREEGRDVRALGRRSIFGGSTAAVREALASQASTS